MAEQVVQSKWRLFVSWPARCWGCVLDLALILWVTRVPVCLVAIGFFILGMAPQAQDLFVEFAVELNKNETYWQILQTYSRILLFLSLLFFIWALPTYYAAHLLIDTDGRLRAHAQQRRLQTHSRC